MCGYDDEFNYKVNQILYKYADSWPLTTKIIELIQHELDLIKEETKDLDTDAWVALDIVKERLR